MSYRTRPNKLRRPSTAVVIGDVYPRGSFGPSARPPLLKGRPRGTNFPPVHQQSGSKRSGGQRRSAQVNTQAPVLRETASTGACPNSPYRGAA